MRFRGGQLMRHWADMAGDGRNRLVSIITCIRNSEKFLKECLDSVAAQTFDGPLELSVFDDGSSDRSLEMIHQWHRQVTGKGRQINLVVSSHRDLDRPKGVGGAKNRAVDQSHGDFLCFLDSDDVMDPDRIRHQYELAVRFPDCLIGCKVRRVPADSTPRYTEWANSLRPEQLCQQIYTCFGPTILMPTWFCSRQCYQRVGRFDQSKSRGVPEDLIFFYEHLRLGGGVQRCDQVLVTYRYHPEATTFSISDEAIWQVRMRELERNVLAKWSRFTIWNAGKEGRRFYRSLSEQNRAKVVAFCDVDAKKLAKRWYTYEQFDGTPKPKVAIVHFTEMRPPVVICVKLGLSGGCFERNLESLGLRENVDYVHFG